MLADKQEDLNFISKKFLPNKMVFFFAICFCLSKKNIISKGFGVLQWSCQFLGFCEPSKSG